jgi:hypothetical protein
MDNDEVDLWAADEVHFQQHGSRCRMWVPPETKDPVLLHHPTRRSVGYFGAVRLRDGRFRFSRETGKFNAMTFFAFLKRLRRTSIRAGRSVVVITDNAKYHHARLHKEWREDHRKDFLLDYLPPYSPESDRTGLETHAPPMHPQPILSCVGGSRRCRGKTVRILGQRK